MKYGAASVIVNYKVRMELWRGLNVQMCNFFVQLLQEILLPFSLKSWCLD